MSFGKDYVSRTPCGVRGLKLSDIEHDIVAAISSHPVWGAWIEILCMYLKVTPNQSHPVWGAWIEIDVDIQFSTDYKVAPRVGCVD